MRKFTLFILGFLLGVPVLNAQTSCSDLNGYVDSKNTAGTGTYTLQIGQEEKAAQTYHYSGPGRISSLRIYGNYPGIGGGVPLHVTISSVDANGRPTTELSSTNVTWWWFYNFTGYITVNLSSGGVVINDDFAVTVAIRTASPWGNAFQLNYTGNGEGLGEDLASLAGTSTGNNWTSAMTDFNKDGDFYLVPRMTNFITSAFTPSASCAATSSPVSFTNESTMTQDSMFNTIALASYSGTTEYYTWDFGDGSPVSHAINPSHSYASAGSYTVTLTCSIDGWNNDCSVTESKIISIGLGVSATTTSPSCYGTSNASVTLTGSGGTPPYLYSLNSSAFQTSGVFNNLPAGTFSGVITDNIGCQSVAIVTVTQPVAIAISNIASTNASCGNADGSLLISASGGTGTLMYSINSGPFQSSPQFNNLASGVYVMHVKDANGCIETKAGMINDQGAPTLSITSQTNITCNGGNNGSIVMIGTGGSGTLQYSIDAGVTWQSNGSFLNLAAGTYQVMVKDGSGCSHAMEITLSQPPVLSFTANSTSASCFGGSDGTIMASSVIGGTGTPSFSLNNVNYQSGNVFNGLPAGTYTVYVRDVASCIATHTAIVTQPTQIIATTSVINATCFDSFTGEITINAGGGSPGYTYSLEGEFFQQSNNFNELEAGTYSVVVRDQKGCQVVMPVTISEPTQVSATITSGQSTCGNSNGTLLAVASGGTGSGYQYSLDGTNFSSNGAYSGLVSGSYNIVVTDGAGCQNVFVTSVIDANGPVVTSISHTNVACAGGDDGTITVNTVTGGTGLLYYSVNGSNWQTSTIFTGLEAGVYSLLVKDQNGCVGETSVSITEPNPIVVTTVTTSVSCFGSATGSVTINAAGGAGTLAYALDGETGFQSSNVFNNLSAGFYPALVRDAAGCIGYTFFTITEPPQIIVSAGYLNVGCHGDNTGAIYVNGSGGTGTLEYSLNGVTYQAGTAFTGLVAGNYTIYVRDINGCVRTLPMTITEPPLLNIVGVATDVVCASGNDGMVNLSVTGGVYPYEFSWSNGAETEDIFNLVSGTYSVSVTDNNGCSIIMSFTITEPLNPMIVNGVIANASSQTAADGSVDITVTGGTGPYTFDWSTGATTEDITAVTPGVYLVTITDANGCVTSGVYIVNFSIGISTNAIPSGAVSLYPNPAHENFTIDAGMAIIDKLEVMDILGQVIYTTEPKMTKTKVNTEVFSQGTYFVRMYVNGGIITKRVEVSK